MFTPLHLAYLQATTASFAGIVACQLGAAMASRAEYASLRSIGFLGNRLLLGSMAFEVVSAAAVIYLPALQTFFGTAGLPLWVVLMMLPFPVLVWSADELYRWIGRRRRKPRASPDPGVPKSLSERTQDPTGDVVGRVC
jgi:magnesium-transporting ATPase (P-type)